MLTALTKTLMSFQPLVGYVSHSASVCWCLWLSKYQASGSRHVGSASASKGWCLAPPGDQRSRLFLVVRRPLKLTNDGVTQFGAAVCGYNLALYDFAAVCWLHVLSLRQSYCYYKNKNWLHFVFIVKAAVLNQQISKFYPQFQRTEASDHIYVINVKAIFCALNLRIKFWYLLF